MKHTIIRMLGYSLLLLLGSIQLRAQDVSINIVCIPATIAVGQTGTVQVTISNNDSLVPVAINKLRPLVSLPSEYTAWLAGTAGVGSNPDNWTFMSNTGTAIRMTNSQPIAPGTSSTYYLNIIGTAVTTISGGSLLASTIGFGGPPTSGNNIMNDNWQSPIIVTAPLPVELEYFKGEADGCNALLTWKTAIEKNFSHFELMRSLDGSHFEFMTTVAGTNIAEGHVYTFTARQDAAVAYYKLKMVDIDGSTTFSSTINRVRNDCNKAVEGLIVYPNPAAGNTSEVHVQYEATADKGKGKLWLSDIAGRVLYTEPVNITSGMNMLHIPVHTLSAGTYLIRLAPDAGSWNLSPVKLIIKDNH